MNKYTLDSAPSALYITMMTGNSTHPLRVFVTLLLAAISKTVIGATEANTYLPNKMPSTTHAGFWHLSLLSGYRTGDFNWSIASDLSGTQTPNILSELTFKDVEFNQLAINTVYEVPLSDHRAIFFDAELHRGLGRNGEVNDTDFDGNDRSVAYSQSVSDGDDSSSSDLTVAFGYRHPLGEHFKLNTLIGYHYNKQNFALKQGTQILATPARTPNAGPISGLDSTYETQWEGGWLGAGIAYSKNQHAFGIDLKYYLSEYYAEGNWNLRTDFAHPKSFAQWADGTGYSLSVDYTFSLMEHWAIECRYFSESWETDAGIDTVYLSNGQQGSTRFNGAEWDVEGWFVGIQRQI